MFIFSKCIGLIFLISFLFYFLNLTLFKALYYSESKYNKHINSYNLFIYTHTHHTWFSILKCFTFNYLLNWFFYDDKMQYIHILASNLFAKKTAVPLLASYGFFLHDCQQTCVPFYLLLIVHGLMAYFILLFFTFSWCDLFFSSLYTRHFPPSNFPSNSPLFFTVISHERVPKKFI